MSQEQVSVPATTRINNDHLQQNLSEYMARKKKGTGSLERSALDLPNLTSAPYGLGIEGPAGFLALPTRADMRRDAAWLIELQGLGRQAIGLHILGDVVFGIARPDCAAPDFDLAAYNADDKGVSRRHAVLRPSQNRLFVIDLQSTNGTRVNAMPVNAGIAKEVRHNDAISLGALNFTVKIIATPDQLASLRNRGEAA